MLRHFFLPEPVFAQEPFSCAKAEKAKKELRYHACIRYYFNPGQAGWSLNDPAPIIILTRVNLKRDKSGRICYIFVNGQNVDIKSIYVNKQEGWTNLASIVGLLDPGDSTPRYLHELSIYD